MISVVVMTFSYIILGLIRGKRICEFVMVLFVRIYWGIVFLKSILFIRALLLLKVLLPLVGIPMIDYSLAWLESAGVEEVFVFCCAHSKQVIHYLEKSQWFKHPNMAVSTIESHNSISAGDALRLIYERNVVSTYLYTLCYPSVQCKSDLYILLLLSGKVLLFFFF